MVESATGSSITSTESPPTRAQHDYLTSSGPNRTPWKRPNLGHGLSQHRVGPYDDHINRPLPRSHHYSRHSREASSSISYQSSSSTPISGAPNLSNQNSYPNINDNPNAAISSGQRWSTLPSVTTPTRETCEKNVNNPPATTRNKNRVSRSVGGFNTSDRQSMHPYLQNVHHNHLHNGHSSNNPYIMHECQELLSQPQGLTSAALHTLRLQGQRFIDGLVGRQHQSKQQQQDTLDGPTKIIQSTLPPAVSRLILTLPILYVLVYVILKRSSIMDNVTQYPEFKWIARPTLNDRKCVLNLFIEKQELDEFNPDFVVVVPEKGKRPEPVIPDMETGSYRTKAQTKVIKRFISSVADSFRPNSKVKQHLVFTGTRDGGHLAESALLYWPPRGKYRTQVYVVADSISDAALQRREDAMLKKIHGRRLQKTDAKDMENLALDYGPLDDIEERFQNHMKADSIHIYDSRGQAAGLIPSDMDDDDVIALHEEAMFGAEDDDILSNLPVNEIDDDAVVASGGTDFISLKKLMAPHLERDESGEKMSETEHVIPYLHVDGLNAARQFDILASAKPLLLDRTINSVVVEHSPNMDMNKLIEFFNSVHYKTFFLGKRNTFRIDHMCPEILQQIIDHPSITPERKPNTMRKILQFLKIVDPDQEAKFVHPHEENQLKFPPFFVAFPRGQTSQEEMTIQHMYDLFGGMSAGGQIKTANDVE